MIVYKEINEKMSQYINVWTLMEKIPVKYTNYTGTTTWIVPDIRSYPLKFCYHRLEGPAVEYRDGGCWYYYGEEAESKEEFYEPEWRRVIEIKRFL